MATTPAADPSKSAPAPSAVPDAAAKPQDASEAKLETVTFGSGCFWCTEAVFAELHGVKSAVSGYSGGTVDKPTYEQVCGGRTGHAEVIQVTYDPREIGFAELLEVFWKTHDPTTLNRQGADVGTQYRSAIFYHTDQQRDDAEHYKEKLDKSGAFAGPIVTEITKFTQFFPAEKYHQQYYAQNPEQGYCRAVIQPKLDKFRAVFGEKLKGAKGAKEAKTPAPPAAAEGSQERGASAAEGDPEKVDWSKVDWKSRLNPEQYEITRRAGTERPFTGKYWDLFEDGQYRCVSCGLPLFESDSKFNAHCGWPSFDKTIAKNSVVEHVDQSHGMVRTEVRCRRCHAHLGHVFDDGPTDTGLRYCMNSAALDFVDEAKLAKETKPAEQ